MARTSRPNAVGILTVLFAPIYPVVWPGYTLTGLGLAFVAPLAFAQSVKEKGVTTGRAMAVIALFGYGGTLIGPSATGFISQRFGIGGGFAALLVLALVMIGLSFVFKRRR